ncbi:hypothetical protein CCF61_003900, partial [Salmonella enterica subsp. enterica serovar Glostrup]|nr:hypothetical protein [Salmonella enterica subsp. enterica serovar Glostrup]
TVDAVQKIPGWVSVKMPQPRRMQERAAADWLPYNIASIGWFPVASDCTCAI